MVLLLIGCRDDITDTKHSNELGYLVKLHPPKMHKLEVVIDMFKPFKINMQIFIDLDT